MVLTARDAADRGATIRTRTTVISARARTAIWHDRRCAIGDRRSARPCGRGCWSMPLGPGSTRCCRGALGQNSAGNVRLVQGSHIVVRKLYEHDRCYFFQNADGRIIFAIPYETRLHPDRHHRPGLRGRSRAMSASATSEIDYLCRVGQRVFRQAGDARRYRLELFGCAAALSTTAPARRRRRRATMCSRASGDDGEAPLINVFGGKLTTYRRLAESALEKVEDLIGAKGQAVDPRRHSCRAATFRRPAMPTWWRRSSATTRSSTSPMPAGWSGSTARGAGGSSASPGATPISAGISATISTRPRSRYLMDQRMGA